MSVHHSMHPRYRFAVALATSLLAAALEAAETTDIINYRNYDSTFASAGQPSAEQIAAAKAAGFERIVYIAFSDHENSLPNEDRVVKGLGLEYAHVPVDWDAPRASDFRAFAGIMQSSPAKRTLLHCQVNYRASAFAFLYRVLHQGVPMAEAKADMNAIWTPNANWTQFIHDVLEAHGRSLACDGCVWDTSEP